MARLPASMRRARAARPSPTARRFTLVRHAAAGIAPVLACILTSTPLPAMAGPSSDSPRNGAPGMLEPHTGSLLIDYYETFLRDRDVESFRRHVSARYSEGTLGRLIESGNTQARRGAVLALGLFGSFESNAAVARALRDRDPTVRSLAGTALWAIWFRADTPENNEALERVRDLINRGKLDQAVATATQLIDRAPRFAEAYNQRAIAHFYRGRYEESAADCRRVLERNPYHFGALSGLAGCQLRLDQRRDALETFRRALKLRPFDDSLRDAVDSLESEGR